MKNNKNTTTHTTISKGYRLKPLTHKLIKEAQRSLNATQDEIISMAIKLFRKKTNVSEKQKFNK